MCKILQLALFASAMLVLHGCQTTAYYLQSINGQWQLTEKRRKVETVVADPTTPEKLRQRLLLSQRIREFAVTGLALPDNDSYRYYADLGRSRVVWNVFAAPPLSLQPKRWCFAVAGCVSYRGYFHKSEADTFAERLSAEGYDVVVRGITAYSTLGWFNDPLLNTFIYRSEADLAGHIFHELAHQIVYVKNDTAFNESFAMAVEEEGVRRWLNETSDDKIYQSWRISRGRMKQFVGLLLDTRRRLEDIYAGADSDGEKLIHKKKQLSELMRGYAGLKKQWGGFSGFDEWFSGELNNAFFVPISEYYGWLPAFRELMKGSSDMLVFYRKVRELAALDKGSRNKRMTTLKNKNTASNGG